MLNVDSLSSELGPYYIMWESGGGGLLLIEGVALDVVTYLLVAMAGLVIDSMDSFNRLSG